MSCLDTAKKSINDNKIPDHKCTTEVDGVFEILRRLEIGFHSFLAPHDEYDKGSCAFIKYFTHGLHAVIFNPEMAKNVTLLSIQKSLVDDQHSLRESECIEYNTGWEDAVDFVLELISDYLEESKP